MLNLNDNDLGLKKEEMLDSKSWEGCRLNVVLFCDETNFVTNLMEHSNFEESTL